MRARDDLVFPMAEYERRLAELRGRMAEVGVDAMLVTTPENLFYLTGYETQGLWFFAGLVVPLEEEPLMIVRAAEDSVVEDATWVELSSPFEDHEDPMEVAGEAIKEMGLGEARMGYERSSYFFRASEQDALFDACLAAEFVDLAGIIEESRLTKSEPELELMARAARATEAGMKAGIEAVAVGVRENELAAEVHAAMYRAGGHYPAISPFVVAGPRTSVSHATWRERAVEPGDCVFFEIGGCVHRYHAPMMRTVIVGEPPAAMREAETLVLEAMDAVKAAIRPDAPVGEADAAARAVIGRNSFGATQFTRTGYSVGIACTPGWGEGHMMDIKRDDERPFRENMCFHLIPYLQVPGVAAVGISEVVRVTDTGCESIHDFERRLFTA